MAEDNKPKQESRLTAVERAEQERREKMWEMRKALLQRGHRAMQVKQYGDAAVSYEKYLRILELVFNVPQGNLTPEVFKEASKTAEMSIVAGVYWDLMRIYDTSQKFSDRQAAYAKQLSKFAPVTPLHNDIIKQAQEFI